MSSIFSQYDRVAQSPWFDAEFYLSNNPEVARAGLDPVLHFLEVGARDGRLPHADFDLEHYKLACAARGIKPEVPLLHYFAEGEVLGLSPRGDAANADADVRTEKLLTSGLFDLQFYNAVYQQDHADARAGLAHYLQLGASQGQRPNLYFDPVWYLRAHVDARASALDPLSHYLEVGDAGGLQPSLIFETAWYRATNHLSASENCIAHYLLHCTEGRFSPLPEFDADYYYSANKDVRAAHVDPFQHFLFHGYREGRNPSAGFSLKFYVKRYLGGKADGNPLLHYLEHKREADVFGVPPESEASVHRAVRDYSRPSPEFEGFRPLPASTTLKAKLLAFYLPQFHAFPENDEWWGQGFTEWTNIARGVSRFKGHYQPRIPRDLGFYSLEDALPTLRRQISMAKAGGVHGFVFYYYWFNSKRLMERPLEQFLAAPELEFPFCLMWANENWTRRWDGDDREVLIAQDYEPADDERFVDELARHMRDERYIRVQGRAVLMVYRPGVIPDCKKTVQRWRALFKKRHRESPLFVMAQSFDAVDPRDYGFDAAIEFPPHKLTAALPLINDSLDYLDLESSAKVFSYDAVVARSINEPAPDYPLIKTIIPSWDNDARHQGAGLAITGSTPAKYEAWLRHLVERAQVHPVFGEQLVCVNAWNEWCEAAYLEPDLHFGAAYLNATGRVLSGQVQADRAARIVLIGHDAFAGGAQLLLLNLARELRRTFGLQPEVLLLGGGALEGDYRAAASTTIAGDPRSLDGQLDRLQAAGYTQAIVNTSASAWVLPRLHDRGIQAITLIHELPQLLRDKNLIAGARMALEFSRYCVFPTDQARAAVTELLGLTPDETALVQPQGAYRVIKATARAGDALRKALSIPPRAKLVLSVGYGDIRKGFDRFLDLWEKVNSNGAKGMHLCWMGEIEPELKRKLNRRLRRALEAGSLHLPGFREDVESFYAAADAFALMSREDPFPSVVHEALSAGLPVFAFEKSSGFATLIDEQGLGIVVPEDDVTAMAQALVGALRKASDPLAAERRRRYVRDELDFSRYVGKLVTLALPEVLSVSVAVPNYNYEHFLQARLGSILQQSYPVAEVIVLDDASTDGSLVTVRKLAKEWDRSIRILSNKRNSGNVFSQWRKAAQSAKGDLLWIAEADDLADARFLSAMVEAMRADASIVLAFSDSRVINADGSPLWPNYKAYYAEQGVGTLAHSQIFDGTDFIRRIIPVRNLVLNVSAVVWRRQALLEALDRCAPDLDKLQVAGDWRVYIEMLTQPGARVAYVSDELNVHRRHAISATHKQDRRRQIEEISICHRAICQRVGADLTLTEAQASYLRTLVR